MNNLKHYQCSICGKRLSNPVSMEHGIGPVCRIKQKNLKSKNDAQLNIFANRSNYTYSIEGSIIMIQDLGGYKSVTNDMWSVLYDIRIDENIDPQDYLIMYKDSRGIWDGVEYNDGPSPSFFSLNETICSKAKNKLLLRSLKN